MGKSDEEKGNYGTTSVRPLDWPRPSHHDGSDVFGIVSVQVELECHHLVVVRLQLTLHHAVHFIRELQRQTRSVTARFCERTHENVSGSTVKLMVSTPHVCYMHWSHPCFINVSLSSNLSSNKRAHLKRASLSYCTPVMRSLDRALLLNIFPAVFLAAVFSLFSDRPS